MSFKKYLDKNKIFIVLLIIILLGSGFYLAIKKYAEPKFRIQPLDVVTIPDKVVPNPDFKNQDYLNKLLSKEWYWVETVFDSSVGVRPYNLTSFKIKFNSDFSFESSTDCNNVGGNYEIFENKIKFKEIISTKKYCQKSKESEFIDGLEKVSELSFNEKKELIIRFKDSTTFMRFR